MAMATAIAAPPSFNRLSLHIPNLSVRLRTQFYPRDSYRSWRSGCRNSAGCCRIAVVNSSSASNNEGKTAGRNSFFAAFVAFKDRYTGKIRHLERSSNSGENHALPQTEGPSR